MKNRLPTDLQILKRIYHDYYTEFINFDEKHKTRASKMYVPIDIDKLAGKFKADPDLLFGRLYYHLEKKYGYVDQEGNRVPFFSLRTGGNPHCINFAYLSSIFASLKSENTKFIIITAISVIALVISVISIL